MWSWLSLLFVFLLAVGSYSQIDTTEEYKALGYPDGRKIVRDSEGNLYVAYRKKYTQHKVEAYHVFVAKSTDGGHKWQVTNGNAPIERVGDYSQRVPAIAIDGKDTLHVVWYGNDEQNSGPNERQIKYSHSADGGRTWSDWLNIAEVPGYDGNSLWQEHPAIYVDGENRLYVAWQGKDRDHSRSQVKFSMSADGGASWTAWINVNPSQKSSYSRPTILAHSDGGLYILAYGGGDVQQIVWTRSEDGGLTWSSWAAVAPDDCDQRHVSAAIDSQGRLHAAWRQRPCEAGDDAPSQVHYAGFDGEAWSSPVVPGPEPDMYQVFPSIEVTADRQVWLVWSESDHASGYPSENPGSGSIVYVFHSGSGWSSRNKVEEAAKAVFPSLGRHHLPGAGSQVDLVWLVNADSADNSIHYQRLK